MNIPYKDFTLAITIRITNCFHSLVAGILYICSTIMLCCASWAGGPAQAGPTPGLFCCWALGSLWVCLPVGLQSPQAVPPIR